MKSSQAILILLCLLMLQGCVRVPTSAPEKKKSPFTQVNFQDLINRYMKKGTTNSIEGVYSVSGMVIRKRKNLLGDMKEKTTDRKENYATVAILRQGDKGGGGDFIELSLNKKEAASYSIIGEFKSAAAGGILVYKHYDVKGKKEASYTFTRDENSEILEGIRVDNEGRTQVTYKLTYVKLSSQ